MKPVIQTSLNVGRKALGRMPSLSRGVVDCLIFTTVYVVASQISLGYTSAVLLHTLPLVVVIMFGGMLVSGVYGQTVQGNNMAMLVRTSVAFGLAALAVVPLIQSVLPEQGTLRFEFFFLFLAFFVLNTLQPLMAAGEKRRAAFFARQRAKG